MVKFSININELDKVKTFLSYVAEDFITVIATEYCVYFTSNNPELYMHYMFPLVTRIGLKEAELFRVARKDLAGLLIEGLIEFELDDINVDMTFKSKTNESIYKVSVKRQMATSDNFLNKLDIIQEANQYPSFNIEQFLQLIRFSKALNTGISCHDNIAYLEVRGVLIYKKVTAPDFACNGKLFELLSKYTTAVYNVQNYLIYQSSTISIMITKNRIGADPSIDFIRQAKAEHIVKLNMYRMISLAQRLRFKDGELLFDPAKNKVSYKTDVAMYTTDLGVTEIKTRPKPVVETVEENIDDLDLDLSNLDLDDTNSELNLFEVNNSDAVPKFYVPCSILNRVLAYLPSNKVIKLRICTNFIRLSIAGLHVIFGRSDVGE